MRTTYVSAVAAIGLIAILMRVDFLVSRPATEERQLDGPHPIVCRFQLKELLIGLQDFKVRTGKYPASLRELCPVELQRIPTCPLGDASYAYRLGNNGQEFVLHCSVNENPTLTPRNMADLEVRRP